MLLFRRVTIIEDGNIFGITLDELDLFLGKGGSGRGDHIFNSGLVQGDQSVYPSTRKQ